MTAKMASQITRAVTTSATPASTSVAAKANTQKIVSLIDGRDEVESVLVINPV